MSDASHTTPGAAGESAQRLTEAQRKCLTWYETYRDVHMRERLHTDQSGWTMRQVNRLLEMDMLHVGPGGWHVPTEAARAALATGGARE